MNADRTATRVMRRALKVLITVGAGALVCAPGVQADQVGQYEWNGIDRVVAIGDLHGDYEQYMKVLRSSGLVNRRGRWTGGDAHLVQVSR